MRRSPVGVAIKESADDPAVEDGIERAMVCFGLPVGDNFVVLCREAAHVKAARVGRAAAEADRLWPVTLLQARLLWHVPILIRSDGCRWPGWMAGSLTRVTIPAMDRALPDRVRQVVYEIEHEVGEDGRSPALEQPTEDAADESTVEPAVRQILLEMGEDPDREGLLETPSRVRRMYSELTAGYWVDPERLVNRAIFEVDYSEMVVVKDIAFYSLCEHHLLPFFGQAAVAYIPEGRVIGLSKIPRIVEMYARRLQVQERMTKQIADFLMERLAPRGVGVVVEASHLCAVMRGVRKPGTIMTTSHVLGLFRTADRTRAEFFSHLERRPPSL